MNEITDAHVVLSSGACSITN